MHLVKHVCVLRCVPAHLRSRRTLLARCTASALGAASHLLPPHRQVSPRPACRAASQGGLVQAHSVYQSVKFRDGLSPNEKIQMLADKWRNERNFWISAMCFLLWVVLARFYSICKKNLAMRDQISRLQGDPGPEGFGHIPEPLPDSATGGKASTSGVVKKRPVAKKTT